MWRLGDIVQNLEYLGLSRRVDSPLLLAQRRTYKENTYELSDLDLASLLSLPSFCWKKVLELQGVKVPPHCTQFYIYYSKVKFVILFHFHIFTQEISRTYFRTCLKDHAGIDGQRDNLEVHFAVIGGNEFNGDDLMVVFLNFIVLQSLQVSFCYVVEH